jgi:hypothetical protein
VATDEFELLEQAFQSNGPEAVFELLLERARDEKNHRVLFGARIMQVRQRIGLPLIETEPVLDLDGDRRTAYENAFRQAAREAGELCLTAGDIPSAWTYFQALGDRAPVAAAIDKVTGAENLDRVIEIAFREGVNPRKGFELILQHHGICSAITWFGSNTDYESRQHCLRLLVRTLYGDVARALKETIAAAEGAHPETGGIADLMACRPWLFEGNSSYTDSTHLASILRFAPELSDTETQRMAAELADYGQHLNPMFHFRGDPPFEEIYRDHGIYLRALLGEDIDTAIAHFRGKASDIGDPAPAEVLIDLLVRLDRFDEAIQASKQYFPEERAAAPNCPSLLQLCQMAGDYAALREAARQRGDPLSFVAGLIPGGS